MSLSKYFNPIPDASVTFDGATVQLEESLGAVQNDEESASEFKNVGHLEISDITFRANEGEVVLVLGNPTSALFKGLFHGHKHLKYSPEGSIRFKDNEYKQFASKCPHQIIYNNEQDIHFPYLTVEQTIDFALSCKFHIPKQERIEMRDELLKEFGLSHVKKTYVGNDYVRGVSGGERKRISIIETFIANGSVYLWDNSTKGLDSATALEFLSITQKMAKATRSVNFVKISQASDKIVSKFDKILMLGDSFQVFYGTMEECLTHFHDTLQIKKNPNDCIIEYLTSILNFKFKETSNSIVGLDTPSVVSEENQALNINNETDLHTLWIQSPYYKHWKAITSKTVQECTRKDVNPDDISPIFSIPLKTQLKTCTVRAFERIIGDRNYLISQFVSVVVQSLVIGSLFYNIPLTTIGSFSRGSLTFFSILFFTFLSLADMPASFQRQPVVRKHVQLHFYYNWVETLATNFFDCCSKFILVVIFTIILYFLAHLQYNAARFFIFLLFLSVYNFCMVSLFALTALIAPTLSMANLLAGILLLAIAMYASYVIYMKDMHPWFIWIAYLNPAMFAMEAILSNELFNLKLDCHESIIPRGEYYDNISFSHKACAWQGATLGNDYVRGRDYLKSGLKYTYHHVWRNFGIIIGFLCFFLFCSLLAAEYITPLFTRENLLRWNNYLKRYCPFLNSQKKNNKSAITNNDGVCTPKTPIANFSTSSSSVPSVSHQYDTDYNIKHPDETVNNHTKESVAMETQKHVISWKNINYTIGDKKLINDASGYISSGLTALMGESGAGKTTLLNVLSQRTESGVVTGELLIDGQPLTNIDAFRRSIGFVQQQDVHLELLTVRESLEISCVLRGDGDRDYLGVVSNLLRLPSEKLVADLSPTQRKLLSIGVELVTKPSLLLFLDEPTSGLDAEAALTIVQFLKKLSMQGQAILCTIHQPSKSVISYFDNIYLLKRGGECVYFGSLPNACDYFVAHDRRLTFDREMDNPADFVIDVVGSGSTNIPMDDAEKPTSSKIDEPVSYHKQSDSINWAELWQSSPEKVRVADDLLLLEEEARKSGVDFTTSVWSPPSYMEQIKLITKRQYICTKRDMTYVFAKYALNAGAGLFIGFSFWRTKHNINGLQDAIFLCFMMLCVSSPLINQVQDKALQSKEVYIAREARSNTYHWTVLLIAQTIVELPLAISSSTLFFLCCYFCCGFETSARVAGVFYLNYILFSMYYLSFGLWLLYSAPDLQTAAVFVAFLYSFTASFCGVMQPYSLFPRFWTFMYRVSPYTYFIETFVSLLLHDREVNCSTSEMVPSQPVMGQTCGQFMKPFIDEFGGKLHINNTYTVCAYCMYTVGDDFLAQENMSYHHRWRNFGFEWVFVCFNIAAMFVGFYLTYIKKIWPSVINGIKKCIPSMRRSKTSHNPNEQSV
ncbi:CFC_HP_G0031890.mRNA.1.CDS.1 [Saccharomyces cerevisiae]|nr:CFC_HP_G0031890.mRNA.1.CDS.1 [Saccharomyces cerevisiae]CAI6952167.1 CFC_HP_G0031890.mRNA.1.CDS.1 [Saccharomyces cerevisiae]